MVNGPACYYNLRLRGPCAYLQSGSIFSLQTRLSMAELASVTTATALGHRDASD